MAMQKSPRVAEVTEQLYQQLQASGMDVLLDDRKERAGVMFADAELMGIPHRLVISERGLEAGTIEYKHRRAEETENWSVDQVVATLLSRLGR
jgi:prolyl-tRNA synthetase